MTVYRPATFVHLVDQLRSRQELGRRERTQPETPEIAVASRIPRRSLASVIVLTLTSAPSPAVFADAGAVPAGPDQRGSFASPPDSAIPDDAFGADVKRGRAIFTDPSVYAAAFVGNSLKCSNCHLDAGRRANSSPLAAAYVEYPAYREKNGHVNTFEERLRECFRFSMNGVAPPPGDKVLVALQTYAFFLAKGAPTGEALPGRGYPTLADPPLGRDYARGERVFAAKCALCHGSDGAGQKANGHTVYPALWGADSFNWGAGMELIKNAAGFIKANMPLGHGNSLTDQEAWDVATFVDSHERPQDPRFTTDVATTRETFHDPAESMYGRMVNGMVLGQNPPTALVKRP